MSYYPLDVVMRFEETDSLELLRLAKEMSTKEKDEMDLFADPNDVFSWIEDYNFGRDEYEGKYKGYTPWIRLMQTVYDKNHSNSPKMQYIEPLKLATLKRQFPALPVERMFEFPYIDVQEMLGFSALRKKWLMNKQVYVVEDSFAEMLMDTSDVKIPADITKRIPATTFCIDTSKNRCFTEETDAIFVDIHENPISGDLHWYLYKMRGEYFFTFHNRIFALSRKVDANGFEYYSYEKEEMNPNERKVIPTVDPFFYKHKTPEKEILLDNNGKNDTAMFLMQFILYLAAANSDIRQSSITKDTYKKPANGKIKNKFSEVQIWETGYVVGPRIKKTLADMRRAEKEYAGDLPKGSHKSPRPHYRQAHWHHYWTGQRNDVAGRKLVLHWVEGTFVNAKDESDIPVVVHKVGE